MSWRDYIDRDIWRSVGIYEVNIRTGEKRLKSKAGTLATPVPENRPKVAPEVETEVLSDTLRGVGRDAVALERGLVGGQIRLADSAVIQPVRALAENLEWDRVADVATRSGDAVSRLADRVSGQGIRDTDNWWDQRDVLHGAASSAPGMAATMAATAATAPIGGVGGVVVGGAQAFGDAYRAGRKLGINPQAAGTDAMTEAAVIGVLERVGGGKALEALKKTPVYGPARKVLADLTKRVVSTGGTEGLTEAVQEAATYSREVAQGKKFNEAELGQRMWSAAKVGSLMGGGVATAGGAVSNRQAARKAGLESLTREVADAVRPAYEKALAAGQLDTARDILDASRAIEGGAKAFKTLPDGTKIPIGLTNADAAKRLAQAINADAALRKRQGKPEIGNAKDLDTLIRQAKDDSGFGVLFVNGVNIGEVNQKTSQAAGDTIVRQEIPKALQKAAADKGARVFHLGSDKWVVLAPDGELVAMQGEIEGAEFGTPGATAGLSASPLPLRYGRGLVTGEDSVATQDTVQTLLKLRADHIRGILAGKPAAPPKVQPQAVAKAARAKKAKPAAATATPPAATPATPQPQGLAAVGGIGSAISQNLRDGLWAAYQAGKTKHAGVEDPALRAAKKAGISTTDRAAFDAFLSSYAAPQKVTPAQIAAAAATATPAPVKAPAAPKATPQAAKKAAAKSTKSSGSRTRDARRRAEKAAEASVGQTAVDELRAGNITNAPTSDPNIVETIVASADAVESGQGGISDHKVADEIVAEKRRSGRGRKPKPPEEQAERGVKDLADAILAAGESKTAPVVEETTPPPAPVTPAAKTPTLQKIGRGKDKGTVESVTTDVTAVVFKIHEQERTIDPGDAVAVESHAAQTQAALTAIRGDIGALVKAGKISTDQATTILGPLEIAAGRAQAKVAEARAKLGQQPLAEVGKPTPPRTPDPADGGVLIDEDLPIFDATEPPPGVKLDIWEAILQKRIAYKQAQADRQAYREGMGGTKGRNLIVQRMRTAQAEYEHLLNKVKGKHPDLGTAFDRVRAGRRREAKEPVLAQPRLERVAATTGPPGPTATPAAPAYVVKFIKSSKKAGMPRYAGMVEEATPAKKNVEPKKKLAIVGLLGKAERFATEEEAAAFIAKHKLGEVAEVDLAEQPPPPAPGPLPAPKVIAEPAKPAPSVDVTPTGRLVAATGETLTPAPLLPENQVIASEPPAAVVEEEVEESPIVRATKAAIREIEAKAHPTPGDKNRLRNLQARLAGAEAEAAKLAAEKAEILRARAAAAAAANEKTEAGRAKVAEAEAKKEAEREAAAAALRAKKGQPPQPMTTEKAEKLTTRFRTRVAQFQELQRQPASRQKLAQIESIGEELTQLEDLFLKDVALYPEGEEGKVPPVLRAWFDEFYAPKTVAAGERAIDKVNEMIFELVNERLDAGVASPVRQAVAQAQARTELDVTREEVTQAAAKRRPRGKKPSDIPFPETAPAEPASSGPPAQGGFITVDMATGGLAKLVQPAEQPDLLDEIHDQVFTDPVKQRGLADANGWYSQAAGEFARDVVDGSHHFLRQFAPFKGIAKEFLGGMLGRQGAEIAILRATQALRLGQRVIDAGTYFLDTISGNEIKTGGSLRDALSILGENGVPPSRKKLKDFDNYLWAQNVMERERAYNEAVQERASVEAANAQRAAAGMSADQMEEVPPLPAYDLPSKEYRARAHLAWELIHQKYANEIGTWEKAASEWRSWSIRSQLDPLLEIGYLSQDEYKKILIKNQFWIPLETITERIEKQGFLGKYDPLHERKKVPNDEKILPPLEVSARRAVRINQWVEHQRARQVLVDTLEQTDELAHLRGLVEPSEGKTKQTEIGRAEFTYFRDGKEETWVAPKEIVDAMGFYEPKTLWWGWKLMAGVMDMTRAGITLPFRFAIRQTLRDPVNQRLLSENKRGVRAGNIPIANTFQAIGAILNPYPEGSSEYVQFVDHAMTLGLQEQQHYDFGSSTSRRNLLADATDPTLQMVRAGKVSKGRYAANQISRYMRHWGEDWRDMRRAWTAVGFPLRRTSGLVESATRANAFAQAKMAGWNDMAAMWEALETQPNFARHGRVMRYVNLFLPFSNVAVREMANTYRTGKMGKDAMARMALAGATYVMVPSLINWALNDDDEEYATKYPWEKALFYHLPVSFIEKIAGVEPGSLRAKLGGQSHIPVPRPQSMMTMVGVGAEAMLRSWSTKDPRALQPLKESFLANTLAGVASEAPERVGGFAGSMVRHLYFEVPKTQSGRDVVPKWMEEARVPENQTFDSTPGVYEALGGAMGVSPARLATMTREGLGPGGDMLARLGGKIAGVEKPNERPLLPDFLGASAFSEQPSIGPTSLPVQELEALRASASRAQQDAARLQEDDWLKRSKIEKSYPEVLAADFILEANQTVRDAKEELRELEANGADAEEIYRRRFEMTAFANEAIQEAKRRIEDEKLARAQRAPRRAAG